MNKGLPQTCEAPSSTNAIRLEVEQVAEMRTMLHDLANVFTGILITGGLLAQKLDGTGEAGGARNVCDLGERGSELVRQTRALLIRASAAPKDFGREG